jgi:hypothetical protein
MSSEDLELFGAVFGRDIGFSKEGTGVRGWLKPCSNSH